MNIFVLDTDPGKCAEYHCDAHINKMCVEHCQILGSIAYTARGYTKKSQITKEVTDQFHGFPRKAADGSPHPYGIGYRNHPCTQWARECRENYEWLCQLTLEMCKEYTKRYGRKHACEDICNWYYENAPFLPLYGKMTPFAQAMPEDCKDPNAVTAYRNYYKKYKARFAKWAHSPAPQWYTA
jgi:hypothetical protein